MLRFLSAEWLRAFDDALRADRRLGDRFGANPITIAQEISGERGSAGPAAAIRYVISLDGTGGRVVVGATASEADVTFVCDRDTAAGLAQGTLNAQRALTSGRLKLRGEVDRLAAAGDALAGLGDILGPLRADTEF